ncbi:MAG: hypothetical protein QW587_08540 [Candidatus Bathyarchaeia archaeon]
MSSRTSSRAPSTGLGGTDVMFANFMDQIIDLLGYDKAMKLYPD